MAFKIGIPTRWEYQASLLIPLNTNNSPFLRECELIFAFL